jgi:hypothetical protein
MLSIIDPLRRRYGAPAVVMVCEVGAFFENARSARLGSANLINLARPQPQL